ncbi:MAG: PQQ-binding-like beta-propeller repeat protein [Pyrinomonadaceae bacterium]
MTRSLLSFASLLLFTTFVFASEPQVWSVNSRADVIRGEARSVSIDQNGNVTPAPKVTELYKTEQPYIWSSAIDAGGNVYVGTGADGRIYKVSPAGGGAMFADLTELNVSALAVGRNGELFAASSPDGKVYQLDAAGKATVYFDPKEKYIWALAVMSDGSLAVGTGENGKIYRVRSANASPEASVLFDTSETHIISLAADKTGNLYAGTDSSGLVLKFGPDGKPFGLLDSPLREIHELSVAPDGSVYVLALGESASTAKPEASPTPGSNTVSADAGNPAQPPPPQKSKYDLTGAKTAVYRILPDGGSDILWSSPTVVGFSIYAHQTGRGVLLGTSDRGRIYNIRNDGNETLAMQTDASQISGIFSQGTNLYAASSNQGRLFKIGPDTVAEGIYESAVLDAKTTAAWGNLWWTSNGNVTIETRSGNSEFPNETWSGWETLRGEGRRGKASNPAARYFQWRAKLVSGSSLREMNLAFIPRNIAPEITALQVLPANVGLLANPPVQIDPNIELSGMAPQNFGIMIAPQPPRRAFQRGARGFQWTAEDRNADKLLFDVYFKEVTEADFKLLKENISENFVTIDGLSLADGKYLVRVVAKDSPSNPTGQFLSGEIVSEPFDIDNTQPTVTVSGSPQISGDSARVVFLATDRGSFITRAEYSVNGGDWHAVYPDDGISDGPDERYSVSVPLRAAGEYSVTLRVFDSTGNIGNARAVVKK